MPPVEAQVVAVPEMLNIVAALAGARDSSSPALKESKEPILVIDPFRKPVEKISTRVDLYPRDCAGSVPAKIISGHHSNGLGDTY